jgi:hypothetical protein
VQWDHKRAYFLPNSIYAKTELREIIGVRGVYGTISDANRGINASGLQYMAPENVYWEYSAGIGNIFVSYRFCLRGNYLNTPDTQRFSVKGSFDFILELFPAVHYIFMPNLGIKDVVPSGLKKSVHESY